MPQHLQGNPPFEGHDQVPTVLDAALRRLPRVTWEQRLRALGCSLLTKPFRREELARVVRDAFDRAPSQQIGRADDMPA